MTILDQLAGHARERVAASKSAVPLEELRRQALSLPKGDYGFEKALRKDGLSFICECKRASPSKGLIAPEYPYLQIALDYEAAGADCISVLTEPKWFLGSGRHLQEIARTASIPCLRKDFTVDEYMIYEAKVLGASAVLLICAILTERQIREYLHICDGLGLSALVEVHNEAEGETGPPGGGADHRGEQPQPEGLLCGPGQQPPAQGADPPRGAVCFRKRRPQRRRHRSAPRAGSGRSPDRRNSDAGGR